VGDGKNMYPLLHLTFPKQQQVAPAANPIHGSDQHGQP
jgi:hypothetical protein